MIRIFIIILMFIQSYFSIACSCIGLRTVKEEYKKSDAVFKGKILSKNKFILADSNLPSGYKMYKVEFKILRQTIYKGTNLQDTIAIITGLGNGDCGINFKLNEEYIIYSNYSNKYFENGQVVPQFLYTDICTRTIVSNRKEQRKLKRCKG